MGARSPTAIGRPAASLRRLRFGATTALLPALSGCLAFDVIGDQVGAVERPEISPMRHVLRSNPDAAPVADLARVLEWWGPPDERSLDAGGIERLAYHDGVRWRGLVLWLVVLPIPLVVPVGHDAVELELVDGMVTAARTRNDAALVEGYFGLPLHGMWRGLERQPRNAIGAQFQRY